MAGVAHAGIEQRSEKLNAIQLKKLPPGMHSDGGGLYLEVQESGSRSWILRTTVRGKRKDIGLGGLSTKSLSEARKEAAELRTRAKKGEDVLESRRIEKRITPTFKEAALTVHGNLAKTFRSDRHARNWLRSLQKYVFPTLGSKTVDAIDTADVLRAIGPIWTTIPDTARRTLRRVKAIFDYCQAAGHRNVMVGNLAVPLPNPCDGIKTALPNNHAGEKHHEALPYSLVIEAAMAHKVKGIERHYLRTTFFEERQKLMATWAAFATATPGKLVRMRS